MENINNLPAGMGDGVLELGVVQKSDADSDLLRKNLVASGFAIIYTNTEIRFRLKGVEVRLYLYREMDENYFSVFYDSVNNFKFILLGAEFCAKKICKLSVLIVLMYFILAKFIRIFMSKNILMKLFQMSYYVDFIRKIDILPGSLDSHIALYNKKILDEPRTHDSSVISYKYFLVDRKKLVKYTMNPVDLLYALECIYDAFEEYNVEVYLSAGTLLGAVRNGGFIPWDYDADLASKEESFCHALEASSLLLKKGFSIYYSDIWNTIGVYYRGITVDIDFYRSDVDFLTVQMKNINNFTGRVLYYLEWVIVFTSLSATRTNRINGVWMTFARDALIKTFDVLGRPAKIKLARWVSSLARLLNNANCVIQIPLAFVRPLASCNVFNKVWAIPGNFDDYLTLYYGDWRVERKKFSYYDESAKPVSRALDGDRRWEYK
jgi:hypothetical protein